MSEQGGAMGGQGAGGPVVVTGWSVHLPGLAPGTTLGGWAPGAACDPQDARSLLGRKGLLGKEPATRLALCAVHRALDLPPGQRRAPDARPDPDTAVVASSNLGNVATVAAAATTAHTAGVREVSPLDAPNVSSNVIASTVAIWFGFGGPNLTVCSGHPSGLDAVALAALLLAGGRARRVVVVGAEPADPTAAALLRLDVGTDVPLRQAAACVVLEPAGGSGRGAGTVPGSAVVLGPVGEVTAAHRSPDDPETLLVAPGELADGRPVLDLTARLGQAYGALGVLQVAVAAGILAKRGGAAWVACGDRQDGYRATTLLRRGGPR